MSYEILNNSLSELLNFDAENTHNLWPPNQSAFIGLGFILVISLLSSLAGLGGGTMMLPFLMSFFNYSPKDASIVSFCIIFGGCIGNAWSFMKQSQNGKPIIKYEYIFISQPMMYAGAVVGIIINKLFPGITLALIGIFMFVTSSGKVYKKFIYQYQRQNKEDMNKEIKKDKENKNMTYNPLQSDRILYILKNIGLLTLITILLSLSRGSEKFPSIIGIQPCSIYYWIIVILSFSFLIYYGLRNIGIASQWKDQNQSLTQQNIRNFTFKSFFAGILSGYGLGGGFILIPAYNSLGLRPLEASATCIFGICLTSFINTVQGISIGIIGVQELLFFIVLISLITFKCSKILSNQLRKRNRMSYVTGVFLCFLCIGLVSIPSAIYGKYVQSGYDIDVLFGFGSFC